MGAVDLYTAALFCCERWTSQIAVDFDSQQLEGKEEPLAFGEIFPARDVCDVQIVVFSAEILFHKLGALIWRERANLAD